MIYVERKEKIVYINVQLDLLGGTFPFAFHCDSEWSARALTHLLSKALADRISAVRKEEYFAGLKDVRVKKSERRDWFDTGLALRVKR